MRYSKTTMFADLGKLNINSFQWDAGHTRENVRILIEGFMKTNTGADAGRAEVLEYCWKLYEGALNGSGHQVIGRQFDIGVVNGKNKGKGADFYKSIGNLSSDKKKVNGQDIPMSTNWDLGTHANVQQMDKWATVCNDAWILGGVHRRAVFRLVSRRVRENMWERGSRFCVVTAREIIGLLHFGYKFEQVGPWQCMVSKQPVKALSADLVRYSRLHISEGEALKIVDSNDSDLASQNAASREVNAIKLRPVYSQEGDNISKAIKLNYKASSKRRAFEYGQQIRPENKR